MLTLTIVAVGEAEEDTSKVIFQYGNQEFDAGVAASDISYDMADGTTTYSNVKVPKGVLLGLANIVVRTQIGDVNYDNYSTSPPATVSNTGNYAFTGDVRGMALDVIGRASGTGSDAILKAIKLDGHPNAVLVTEDLSRVFVATDAGVDVIDGLTLVLYGHIDLGGDDNVTALTVSPDGNRLYAAVAGKVYAVDVNPGDYTLDPTKYDPTAALPYGTSKLAVQFLNKGEKLPNPAGLINALALNADGTRLFVGVPGSRLFGGDGDTVVFNGGGTHGTIYVVNVDPADKPVDPTKNGRLWNRQIKELDGGLDISTIIATNDPLRMAYTTRGDLNAGFHTIIIDKTNDPTNFKVVVNQKMTANDTGTPISLVLNKEPIGTSYFGLPLPDGTQFGSTPYRTNKQYYDLDIRNATGVAILPDQSYAFVADYDLPRVYFYAPEDSQRATDDENLHQIGAKIGIIADPFTDPHLIAATTPIPLGFIQDLVLSGDGTKLYATYRGAGNILVFDVNKLIARATATQKTQPDLLQRFPIDDPNTYPDDGLKPNLPPVDVPSLVKGLAIQDIAAITILSPSGSIDVDSASPQKLDFTFHVDIDTLGLTAAGHPSLNPLTPNAFVVDHDPFHADLYVSALQPGQGLWPSDPQHPRDNFDFLGIGIGTGVDPTVQEPNLNVTDGDPNRIYTSKQNYSAGFLMGHKYSVNDQRMVTDLGFVQSLWDAHDTEVIFDPSLSHILTAGQTYYVGVQLHENFGSKASASFQSTPVETGQTYGVVTVLTHGFQFGTQVLPNQDQTTLQAPDAFLAIGGLIAQAGGGGIVLEYNKQTGQWVDATKKRADGTFPASAVGAAALAKAAGKSVVLVSDWDAESDIADSGFAEAAADSLYASLVDLNSQTNGALFQSPLHFIGHSRGTSVNSEIVQRLGINFTDVTNITLTSLDPHDQNQPSLDIPLAGVLKTAVNALKVAEGLAAGSALIGNFTANVTVKLLDALQSGLNQALMAAQKLGVDIDPIKYADFQDPDVQYWSNVAFADNYYQQAADEQTTTNSIAFVINGTAAILGTIQDPKAAAQRALDFFNGQKDIIVKDAKQALSDLGATAKADAIANLKDLQANFVKNLNDTVAKVVAQANTHAQAALSGFVMNVEIDAKNAASGLAQTFKNNTTAAVNKLASDAATAVQTAVQQFYDNLVTGTIGALDDLSLDNILQTLSNLAALTQTSLQALLDGIASQIQTLSANAINGLVSKNLTDTQTALGSFGGTVLMDAEAAADTFKNKLLQDVTDAFSGLVTLEIGTTTMALQKLVDVLESEAVTTLTDKSKAEFDR